MDLYKIIINKRSGCIHNRHCESVKQMKESNKDIQYITDIEELENMVYCNHCMKRKEQIKLEKIKYQHKLKILIKHREHELNQIKENYNQKEMLLKKKYHENIELLNNSFKL